MARLHDADVTIYTLLCCNTHCFLVDIIIVNRGSKSNHPKKASVLYMINKTLGAEPMAQASGFLDTCGQIYSINDLELVA